MPTLPELRARFEAERLDAEHRAADADAAARRVLTAAEAAGGDAAHLPADQAARVESLIGQRREARAQIARAEAQLDAVREAEGDLSREQAAHRASRPTGAGGGGREIEHGRTPDGPRWVRSDGRSAAVDRAGTFESHPVVAEHMARAAGRDQAAVAQWGGVGQMVRAMSTGSGSSIVPTIWSGRIIDRARNVSQVIAAGAETIPMDSKTLQIGRLTADPVPAWHTEAGTITATDPTFDSVQLVAKTLSCLTVASLEFLQDATNADQVIEEAIGKAMGLKIDYAALFGGVVAGGEGLSETAPPSPVGILANLLANAPSSVLGSGTNGTAITPATPWNELITTVFTPRIYNEDPTAVIMNAKMAQKYAMTYDTLGQPLRQPDALANIPWLISNQIPSFTQGTMTSIATDLFAGDFRQVLIGQRMDLNISVLTERYAELGQVGILATWRGDVQLARPRSMAVYRYIGGM